ncbi:uncharacterized protein LY79DRAFT_135814 [Colletotrichum navitas]|uniref:Uncharacterized protein n=1 Tax=Colletotrichum navitas TaxID=681940 RepID=A0AAD8Q2E7_9PEZI|nr:uncharacterized protein LY79DRAFT_135814 [Colletotrichum navitas]KAK1594652.1 hypothetical protein LY79DRAFT_135814 [Colletotrichum navitas]
MHTWRLAGSANLPFLAFQQAHSIWEDIPCRALHLEKSTWLFRGKPIVLGFCLAEDFAAGRCAGHLLLPNRASLVRDPALYNRKRIEKQQIRLAGIRNETLNPDSIVPVVLNSTTNTRQDWHQLLLDCKTSRLCTRRVRLYCYPSEPTLAVSSGVLTTAPTSQSKHATMIHKTHPASEVGREARTRWLLSTKI